MHFVIKSIIFVFQTFIFIEPAKIIPVTDISGVCVFILFSVCWLKLLDGYILLWWLQKTVEGGHLTSHWNTEWNQEMRQCKRENIPSKELFKSWMEVTTSKITHCRSCPMSFTSASRKCLVSAFHYSLGSKMLTLNGMSKFLSIDEVQSN